MRLERYPECLWWGCRTTLFLRNRINQARLLLDLCPTRHLGDEPVNRD